MLPSQTPSPFQPDQRPSGKRRFLWLLPLATALVFAIAFARWAQGNDELERAAAYKTHADDAHSVDAQLMTLRAGAELRLRDAAATVSNSRAGPVATLRNFPKVQDGVRDLWTQVTWLDKDNRIVASLSRTDLASAAQQGSTLSSSNGSGSRCQQRSQKDFLEAPLRDEIGRASGKLVADFLLTDLLCGTDLNWLNARYQIQFVSDQLEEVLFDSAPQTPALGQPFVMPLRSFEATSLTLTPMRAEIAWYQSARTMTLLGGLMLFGFAASVWLRREMNQVRRAVTSAQTEAAWRQSMEDSALVALRARDPDGRLLYVNKTLCDMVGYSAFELIGLKPPLPFWPADAVDEMMARNLKTLAGDAPPSGFESRWQHRDGHLIDVMVFESRLLDSAGQHIGWMGSIVDISARKRLEEKDRQHVEHMAQHARLNDVGLLASELAHELNQPLTTIVAYSEGLNDALKNIRGIDAELLTATQRIQKNAKRAGEIVNKIRRQAQRSEPQRHRVSINAILQDAIELRRRQFAKHRVQVRFEPAPEPCDVLVDRVGIEQVIGNLMRNAGDAMADQLTERTLHISARRQRPEGQSVDGPTGICISITDNGPGLQGRSLETLCGTFYSTKHDGMGLGLGICRAIVESHNGTMTATEATEGGACFNVFLPTQPHLPH